MLSRDSSSPLQRGLTGTGGSAFKIVHSHGWQVGAGISWELSQDYGLWAMGYELRELVWN